MFFPLIIGNMWDMGTPLAPVSWLPTSYHFKRSPRQKAKARSRNRASRRLA